MILLFGCTASLLIAVVGEDEERQIITTPPLSVETLKVRKTDYQIDIPAWGIVEPQEKIDICVEVLGKVTQVSQNLHTGSRVQENTFLFLKT